MTRIDYKAMFEQQLSLFFVPAPAKELMFAKSLGRRWKFDYAWPDELIAVEYEGIWGSGSSRHTSKTGYEEDCVKYNTAQLLGWRVIRITARMVDDGRALVFVRQAFGLET